MKWKALVVILGVFLLGIGGGVMLDRMALYRYSFFQDGSHGFRDGHRPPGGRLLHRLTRKLDLSEAQQRDVGVVLKSTRTELKTMHRQMRQRVDGLLKTSESRIREVLEPEQRETFEQLVAEHRARRKQRRHFRRWRHHHDAEHEPAKSQ